MSCILHVWNPPGFGCLTGILHKGMTPRQMRSIVKYMKANGVHYYREGNIVICTSEIPPEKLKAPTHIIKPKKVKKEETDPALLTSDQTSRMPSDTDLLFYSTDSFDSITESRKDDTPRS